MKLSLLNNYKYRFYVYYPSSFTSCPLFSTTRHTIRPTTSHCFVCTYPRILLRVENGRVKERLKGMGSKMGSNSGLVSCVSIENFTSLSYVCKCVIELLIYEKIYVSFFVRGNDRAFVPWCVF
jgi:uncharacterized protein YkvS